jgi:nitrous oxidase accessory protein NosD
MKFKHILVAASLAAAAPALAQTAAVEVTAGATVYGPQGNEVGKIDKVDGTTAVVNTGKHNAALPTSAFGKNEKGLLVSMTREQLDSAVEAAEAKATGALQTALVAGAAVHSSDGQPMGTIKAVTPEGVVTITRESGEFSLKKDAFTTDANGVALLATKAAIDDAVSKQAPAAAAAPAAQ